MPKDKLEIFSGSNDYHKEYYKKNKELIRAKRLLNQKNIVTQDVKQWKIDKMNDPWAFYPFHDYQPFKKRLNQNATNQEGSTPPNTECGTASTPPNTECGTASTSNTSIPYSSPTLTV